MNLKLKVPARTEQEIKFSIPQFNRTVFPRLIFYSRSSVQHIQPARPQHHGVAGPQKRLSDTHSTKRSKKKRFENIGEKNKLLVNREEKRGWEEGNVRAERRKMATMAKNTWHWAWCRKTNSSEGQNPERNSPRRDDSQRFVWPNLQDGAERCTLKQWFPFGNLSPSKVISNIFLCKNVNVLMVIESHLLLFLDALMVGTRALRGTVFCWIHCMTITSQQLQHVYMSTLPSTATRCMSTLACSRKTWIGVFIFKDKS